MRWCEDELGTWYSLENVLGSAVLLIAVSHVTDGDGDLEAGEGLLGGGDLGGQCAGGKDVIEERLGAELDDSGDVWGLGVGLERVEERVSAGLPLVATVEAEPDQGVDAEASIPGSVYNVVAKDTSLVY